MLGPQRFHVTNARVGSKGFKPPSHRDLRVLERFLYHTFAEDKAIQTDSTRRIYVGLCET